MRSVLKKIQNGRLSLTFSIRHHNEKHKKYKDGIINFINLMLDYMQPRLMQRLLQSYYRWINHLLLELFTTSYVIPNHNKLFIRSALSLQHHYHCHSIISIILLTAYVVCRLNTHVKISIRRIKIISMNTAKYRQWYIWSVI